MTTATKLNAMKNRFMIHDDLAVFELVTIGRVLAPSNKTATFAQYAQTAISTLVSATDEEMIRLMDMLGQAGETALVDKIGERF